YPPCPIFPFRWKNRLSLVFYPCGMTDSSCGNSIAILEPPGLTPPHGRLAATHGTRIAHHRLS
ncbi:MAG TPA: hypothetical protein VN019_05105, partial [Oxalicibacterium sp.]|nr:hypothetical protein [Oxalicibacterium sp.]